MKIEIYNKRGEKLVTNGIFQRSMKPAIGGANFNTSFDALMGQYGVNDRGDGKFMDRTIDLKYDLASKTDALFEEEINTIAAFFAYPLDDKPFWLYDTGRGKKCEVVPTGLQNNNQDGLLFRLHQNSMISFRMKSGLWETINEVSISQEMDPGNRWDFSLPANIFETYPIMEIVTEGNNFDLNFDIGYILESVFVAQRNIRLQYGNFTSSVLMRVDNRNGKIYTISGSPPVTSTNNRILTGGNYFPLRRGSNSIKYDGDSTITVTLKYYPRTYI